MTRRDGDYMNDITRYIESNLRSGYREDQLRFLLLNQGYSRSAIDKAFRAVALKRHNEPAPMPASPAKVEMVSEPIAMPKKQGFFSKLFGMFSSKKKSEPKSHSENTSSSSAPLSDADFVQIDSNGNMAN